MITVKKAQKYIKLVGFLAILCAVILFPPASAHAGMVHGDASSHHTEHASGNHDGTFHSMDVATTIDTDPFDAPVSQKHDGGSQCCSGMCASTVLLDFHGFHEEFSSDSHVAQPFIELASANLLGFLRPPNL